MRLSQSRRSIAVIASALVAGALATGAAAATKPSSGFYLQTKGALKETVVSFSLKGTKLYDFTHFDKCVADLIQTPVVTQIKGASFSFHKVVTADGGKGKYDLNFSGHFSSATSATGIATYKKTKGDVLGPAGCHSTVKFSVKRNGPPRPPNEGS
jgi:hypothetical protein